MNLYIPLIKDFQVYILCNPIIPLPSNKFFSMVRSKAQRANNMSQGRKGRGHKRGVKWGNFLIFEPIDLFLNHFFIIFPLFSPFSFLHFSFAFPPFPFFNFSPSLLNFHFSPSSQSLPPSHNILQNIYP